MDDFEREIARSLQHRVDGLPESYDARPSSITRARRRRASKIGGAAAAIVFVAVGTVSAVAVAHNDIERVSTAVPTTTTSPRATSVPTLACPVTNAITPDRPWPPPVTTPRAVSVGGADSLVSFAATTDERYIVLAPKGWHCSAQFAADGQNGMAVDDNGNPGMSLAAISVLNDFLWHGGVGSTVACSVSDDAAVKAYIQANYPQLGPCPAEGRTLTRVDAHTTRFVDSDGGRGAGWIELPSSSNVDDGKVSVLTCHPTTDLSAADCDVIIADWIARVSATASVAPTTVPSVTAPRVTQTTASATGQVPSVNCPVGYGVTNSQPLLAPSNAPRAIAGGDVSLAPSLSSYAATTVHKFIVLGPSDWSCRMTVAADGRATMVVADPTQRGTISASAAPIEIEDDWLWHGEIGSTTACSVFDDAALVQFRHDTYPQAGSCPESGRTVTRFDAHFATFVDADGARGAAHIVLPSSQGGDGLITVLTCRPTRGLTPEVCDTIVADYFARLRGSE